MSGASTRHDHRVNIDEIRDEWDAAADSYDRRPDHGMLPGATRDAWWRLLADLLPSPPSRVADLGCGTGSVAVLLAVHGFDVIGIDISPRMLDHARARAGAEAAAVRFALGDVTDPDLDTASVDVIFSRDVIWALPDPADALRNWLQLLAPHGRLVLVEGRWGGEGVTAESLSRILEPHVSRSRLVPLEDPLLWGTGIDDERYALIAEL